MDTANTEIAASRPVAIGDAIGPYRILRQLGHGTTSRVFEVEHERIGRRAALKIVHREGVAPGIVDRLFIEARAVNLINHPHVVEISDILVPDADQPDHALVMELLDGRSLADVIAAEGPLPPARFLPILAEICAGLAAVHRAGFVHRDLKPENVFLVDRGPSRDFVKLLDFGLVKAIGGGAGGVGRATIDGMFMGSPAYAAPEQAAGKTVDFRADIYAVGVMLHELVTGQLPFQAEHIADMLMQQINAAPPRLPAEMLATDLGRALDAIIQACLIKDPCQRALSAAQLADMFRRLVAGDRAVTLALPHVRRPRSGSGRLRAIAIAPLVAFGVLGFFAWSHRQAARPASSPAIASPLSSDSVARTSPPTGEPKVAPAPDQPAAVRSPPGSRGWARTPLRLSKAMTLDPYR